MTPAIGFAAGLVVGFAVTLGVLLAVRARQRRPRCPHDHIRAHSTMTYLGGGTRLSAICLDCARPIEFKLGECAGTKGAQMKAATAVLVAQGYRLVGDYGNDFERKRA